MRGNSSRYTRPVIGETSVIRLSDSGGLLNEYESRFSASWRVVYCELTGVRRETGCWVSGTRIFDICLETGVRMTDVDERLDSMIHR